MLWPLAQNFLHCRRPHMSCCMCRNGVDCTTANALVDDLILAYYAPSLPRFQTTQWHDWRGRGKPRKREMEKKDATDDPRSHRPPSLSLPRSVFIYSPARLCNSALTNQSAWREKGPHAAHCARSFAEVTMRCSIGVFKPFASQTFKNNLFMYLQVGRRGHQT